MPILSISSEYKIIHNSLISILIFSVSLFNILDILGYLQKTQIFHYFKIFSTSPQLIWELMTTLVKIVFNSEP